MNLLINLNEPFIGAHANIHDSLARLKEKGILTNYHIYSFLARLKAGLSSEEVVDEIIAIAKEKQPTAILWSHTRNLSIDKETINKLRSLASKPVIGYWDGDIYQKPQPVPKQMLQLCTLSDVIFCQGAGDFSSKLKKHGCKDIRYVVAFSDELRFFNLRPSNRETVYDAVMIGNNYSSLLPWRIAPGSKLRKKIAQLFYNKLGNRFALYGSGWNEKFAKGPLPFEQQVTLYHSSRIALGANNWLGPKYYFSNRLPIAMSSGIPVVHNYEEGFDEIFKDESGVYFYNTAQQAWDICYNLLQKSQAELDNLGMQSYNYSMQNFHVDKVLSYMVEVLKENKRAQRTPLLENMITNPWIGIKQL